MQCLQLFALTFFLFCFGVCKPLDCEINPQDPLRVAYTITVDWSGRGNFRTVQAAIDSIPCNNNKWIRIQVFPGRYIEKVTIPQDKPCIFLDGAGSHSTRIEWGDHDQTDTSATFTSYPDYIVVKDITFKNTYDIGLRLDAINITQALSARIYGDKSAFYHCSFMGLQDTLWDVQGHHYFYNCYIEGAIDFIFGSGQSIYERCALSLNIGAYAPERPYGTITAQGRNSLEETNGFVFKSCTVYGNGKAYLGRAYGAFSRVIFYNSEFAEVIVPEGWDAWNSVHHERNISYAETDCRGPGADTSKRVPWTKKVNALQLRRYLDISYINKDGWMANLPNVS